MGVPRNGHGHVENNAIVGPTYEIKGKRLTSKPGISAGQKAVIRELDGLYVLQ